MKTGTKSVLFGVHAFWFHPITVLLAWIELYGLPNWKETVCIFIHDLGYWGCETMDGEDGEKHPLYAHHWAMKYLDTRNADGTHGFTPYAFLCLWHSRTTAKKGGVQPSILCWADKLSIKYDPRWFYLLRARLSGELYEYLYDAISHGLVPANATDNEWFAWARERGMRAGYTQNPKRAYELEQK